MRKSFFIVFFVFAILFISPVSAIKLDIEKISDNEVLVIGSEKPVVFDLNVKNLEAGDNFESGPIVEIGCSHLEILNRLRISEVAE